MIIYLDMDDVVADWLVYAQEFLKMRWDDSKSERIPQSDWDKLKNDSHFYRNLPIKEGAHDLVNFCRDLKAEGIIEDLRFLTALPHDYSMPFAAWDKMLWAMERFERIPVLFGPFSHDKWRHCTPGDILIDDRHSNCSEWINAGGKAHVYKNWPKCREWLEQISK